MLKLFDILQKMSKLLMSEAAGLIFQMLFS